LAAHALVEEGEKSPYTTFQNNIIGSLNILELCRIHAVSRIIIASTAHVYGDAPPPCEETEPPRPSRPYETSKTCVDLIAQSYADTYQLPVIIPRFSNIYGPGDMNMTRIIPKTIHAILHGLSPTYWNDGIKREYLYIDDAIRAYDMMGKGNLDIMSDNRILNFGTGNPVNAKKIIQMIIQHMNDSIIPKEISSPRKHEIPFQQVSWEKAKHLLGWKPLVTLEEGLSRTIRWYRSRH
jgi:CDP-glucose 4,6-dehydratase